MSATTALPTHFEKAFPSGVTRDALIKIMEAEPLNFPEESRDSPEQHCLLVVFYMVDSVPDGDVVYALVEAMPADVRRPGFSHPVSGARSILAAACEFGRQELFVRLAVDFSEEPGDYVRALCDEMPAWISFGGYCDMSSLQASISRLFPLIFLCAKLRGDSPESILLALAQK